MVEGSDGDEAVHMPWTVCNLEYEFKLVEEESSIVVVDDKPWGFARMLAHPPFSRIFIFEDIFRIHILSTIHLAKSSKSTRIRPFKIIQYENYAFAMVLKMCILKMSSNIKIREKGGCADIRANPQGL